MFLLTASAAYVGFSCTEEAAERFKNSLPYSERAYPRIVFAPMSRWNEIGEPDLVDLFVKPDQLGAAVSMLCSHNGSVNDTVSPYCSACRSIMFGAEQMERENPTAVMGTFDISQRYQPLANLLSLTMPYSCWAVLCRNLDKSCLMVHSWRTIEKRLKNGNCCFEAEKARCEIENKSCAVLPEAGRHKIPMESILWAFFMGNLRSMFLAITLFSA